MIKDVKLRAKVKRYLIGANIALGFILFSLIVYWLASIRPGQIEKAEKLGQYRAFAMDDLPFNTGEIEPDYIGFHRDVADTTEEIDIVERELATIDADSTSSNHQEEDFSNKTGELIEKTNKILAQQNKALIEEPKKQQRQYKGKPKVSIIVTNLGLNRRSTELSMTLPKQCALGFLPYTKSLKPLLHKAQSKGHEIYLYLPLQTSKSFDNPGRYALMGNLAPEENAVRLNVILNSHARYDGLYSSYKEVFTENVQASEMVFDHLDDKNLIFILGKGFKTARPKHMKSHDNILPTNLILDEEPDKEYIRNQLEKLVHIAEDNGLALGYAQGFTLTIEMIRDWAQTLRRRGIELVPISELLKEYNS